MESTSGDGLEENFGGTINNRDNELAIMNCHHVFQTVNPTYS